MELTETKKTEKEENGNIKRDEILQPVDVLVDAQDTQDIQHRKQEHVQDLFNDSFVSKHPDLLAHCSLIIGMHPDEATEYIVDVAIKHKKPFAIVPCCVFPKSGKSMSLEQWYDYLESKTSHMKICYLNFVGRNRVLYVTSYE